RRNRATTPLMCLVMLDALLHKQAAYIIVRDTAVVSPPVRMVCQISGEGQRTVLRELASILMNTHFFTVRYLTICLLHPVWRSVRATTPSLELQFVHRVRRQIVLIREIPCPTQTGMCQEMKFAAFQLLGLLVTRKWLHDLHYGMKR